MNSEIVGFRQNRALQCGGIVPNLDQQAQREFIVHHGLADIKHTHVVGVENRRERLGQAGLVVPGNIEQQNLPHGV